MSLNFQFAKISTAAMVASAPGPTLLGAHARQDTLAPSVKKVSGISPPFYSFFFKESRME